MAWISLKTAVSFLRSPNCSVLSCWNTYSVDIYLRILSFGPRKSFYIFQVSWWKLCNLLEALLKLPAELIWQFGQIWTFICYCVQLLHSIGEVSKLLQSSVVTEASWRTWLNSSLTVSICFHPVQESFKLLFSICQRMLANLCVSLIEFTA